MEFNHSSMLKNRYLKQWDSTSKHVASSKRDGAFNNNLETNKANKGLWAYGIESNDDIHFFGDRKKLGCHVAICEKKRALSHGGLTGGDLPKLFHQGPNQQTQGFHMISPDVGRPRCVKPRFLDFGSPKKGMFFVQGRTIKGKLK